MPWSIFTDGGGPGAALTWATDLLKQIGAPLSPGNTQFVYDWEVSEGGGGKYNPLNQGPVPGQPSLTTTGQQYGGGAADYANWQAGLTGAADYLDMPSFASIKQDLVNNNPAQARADLISSPWAASHYGNGSSFSNSPVPGSAAALPAVGGSVGGGSSSSSSPGGLAGIPDAISAATSSLGSTAKTVAFTGALVIAGGALVVWGFARATGSKPVKTAAHAAEGAAAL